MSKKQFKVKGFFPAFIPEKMFISFNSGCLNDEADI